MVTYFLLHKVLGVSLCHILVVILFILFFFSSVDSLYFFVVVLILYSFALIFFHVQVNFTHFSLGFNYILNSHWFGMSSNASRIIFICYIHSPLPFFFYYFHSLFISFKTMEVFDKISNQCGLSVFSSNLRRSQ